MKHPVLHRIAIGLHVFITILSVTACAVGIYIHVLFPAAKLEELSFYLTGGIGQGGGETFGKAAAVLVAPILVVSGGLLILQYGFRKKPVSVSHTSKKSGKTHTVHLLPIRPKWLFTAVAFLLLVGIGLAQVGTFSYLISGLSPSEFIETNYVDPKLPGRINTPTEKRNLIFIELESLETSFFSTEHGGLFDEDIIPEMYELLSDEDAIYFATDDNTHGTLNAYGSTWTTAALVGYTCGIPLKVPSGKQNSYHSDSFLYGAWGIGDVLQGDGYQNILVSGAGTSFGGLAELYTAHGNYTIVDSENLSFTDGNGKTTIYTVPDSQLNAWGISDEATFKIARQVLTSVDETSNEPWHVFIKTTDAHFNGYTYSEGDGYEGSVTKYAKKVQNVYATSSREAGSFIEWLKEQTYYENTTVVIVGDHPNMLTGICGDVEADDRGRYNVILNSTASTKNTKNRKMTAYDFYPTILTAMGYEIKGDRLGLGTDLFSDTPTLTEIYGIDTINEELEKNSEYYIEHIMGRDDYAQLGGE